MCYMWTFSQLFLYFWFHMVVASLYRSSPPEVFLMKRFMKTCSKFTREQPSQSVISIKLGSGFIEITLRHRCFSVTLLHIFRTPFKSTSGGLLLPIKDNRRVGFVWWLLPMIPCYLLWRDQIWSSLVFFKKIMKYNFKGCASWAGTQTGRNTEWNSLSHFLKFYCLFKNLNRSNQ